MEFLRRIFGSSKSEQAVAGTTTGVPETQVDTAPLPREEVERANEIFGADPVPKENTPKSDEEAVVPLQTRPLAPPEEFKSSNHVIRYGVSTHKGRVRTNNQDSTLTFFSNLTSANEPPPIGLFVVADGMGGHHDGERASELTVQTLAQVVLNEIIQPQMMEIENTAELRTIPEVLTEAMTSAHDNVKAQVPDGGTTATCAVIRGDLAYIAHVGDSRAYLVNGDTMELITRDHSLVQRLIELGQLTEEEAEVHPQRNVLYRALGQGDTIEPDTSMRRLPPASRLLLCSDGLWSVIGDQKIKEILEKHPDPQEACDLLIDEANQNGGPDNISAVLIQMPK